MTPRPLPRPPARAALLLAAAVLALATGGVPLAAQEEAEEGIDPAIFEPTLGQREEAYIDTALEAMNMTRRDLAFDKKPIDDPYRLEIASRLLDEPLECPGYADRMQVRVAHTYRDPTALLRFMAESTDLDLADYDMAFERHVAAHGVDLPRGARGLPKDVRRALDLLLDGIWEARALAEQAFVGLSGEEVLWLRAEGLGLVVEEESEREAFLAAELQKAVEARHEEDHFTDFLDVCMKVGREDMAAAAALLSGRVEEALEILVPFQKVHREELDRLIPTLDLDTPLGRVVIGGPGRDRFEGAPPVLLIDFGGDDEYVLPAARAVGFQEGETPVAVAIDLGGDDYHSGRRLLSNGAGFLGAAVFYDLEGDDVYRSGSLSQGSGLLGAGVMVDRAGDDTYYAGTGVQGAATFGFGLLIDEAGRDHYNADLFAQGFSRTMGFGLLVEAGGTDLYFAGGRYPHFPLLPAQFQSLSQGFSIGYRPHASAGLAALFDFAGNDRYIADVYGQGASYWFGVGLLVDNDGFDDYVLYQYGMGGGIHLTTGILIDRGEGNDRYSNQLGVGMGGAHDWAVGWLVDKGGNDYYQGCGITQGGTNANSAAFFIDSGGNDSYSATYSGSSQGASIAARDYGGIAVFLDLGGKDRYTQGGEDDTIWVRSKWGAGIDVDSEPKEEGR